MISTFMSLLQSRKAMAVFLAVVVAMILDLTHQITAKELLQYITALTAAFVGATAYEDGALKRNPTSNLPSDSSKAN